MTGAKLQTIGQAPDLQTLCDNFVNRTAVIGVIGLGYVGVPLVCAVCDEGFKSIGFDIDDSKITRLNSGESYIGNIHSDRVKKFRDDDLFEATGDFSRLSEADAILMCVPTPLTRHREPDLSYVESTARAILPHLRAGQLIVLESTTYPGTLREVVKPIL